MTTILLTAYILVWPVLVAIVLFVIGRAFLGEWREARREGRSII
ncbi:MAG: putative transporter small subunit [Propionibacteriaceae bacterium]